MDSVMILTEQHQRPERLINTGAGTVSLDALIKQGDVARMSTYRLYRHEEAAQRAEAEAEAEQEAIGIAEQKADTMARIAAVDAVIDELPDAEVEELTYVYPAWSGEGIGVVLDQKVRHNGILYRVVQPHTTQPDWPPDATPALFTRYRDPAAAPEPWVQPTGAQDTYSAGTRVTHAGQTWVSDVDNNSWEPGVYGWTVEAGQ